MDHTVVSPGGAEGAPAPPAQAPSGRRRLDLLVRLAREGAGAAADRIPPRGADGPAPLSYGQERLWLLGQLDRSVSAFNIRAAYRLRGVDVPALERALGETVRRHQALRTVFAEAEGAPVQVVAPFAGFALEVEDLSELDEGVREREAVRRASEEAERPFDLSAGPLFRARLLRLGEGDDVLLLVVHHAVADGWSMGVLMRELSALYAAFREGRDAGLPEPALQYADYAAWERGRADGGAERQLAYWKERLAGAPALLELPADRPRPAARTYGGARVSRALSGELLERLRARGQGEGATLAMVLLAAFQALLARYGCGDDVVVGTPVAGRSRPELEGVVGFFANTVALRTDLSGDPTVRELLRRVREVTLGAYEHQELPFDRLVAELQPERSLSHSPVFQVVFAPETAGPGDAADGLPRAGVELEGSAAQYDLALTTVESPGALRATLNYSTDLFDRPTVERMLEHYARVLEQVAADGDLRLSRLVLADDEERRRVVEEWNRTDRPYPRDVSIPDLFHAQVRARPDAVALTWGDASLTYAELDARANRLARHLAGLGVRPEHRVGVLLERGVELIVSLLAVLKAGGAYVPLDPAYPPERLRLMLADAGAGVLLSEGALAEPVDAPGVRVVLLDRDGETVAAESADAFDGGAGAGNLAYIVYTSGSTGRPKGVMVGHRETVQLVVETDYVQLRPGDRVAQASNASFDALTFEAWGALLNGATLVGIPRDVLLSPPALRDLLREERITTLYQTTALLNQLSREQPDIFAPLREVLFGGQQADADAVRRILAAGKPARLVHVYGPTETTAWCSWENVEQVDDGALTVSVGRPTGNQRIFVLDAALHPAPLGVPGEAYVGGGGVVRGYLDRPALTAERFVPDPFAAEPGARMYRTGDRLRWMPDGRLEFVGRVDEQVKIRGFRIEPGEVESVLSTHPDVAGARVIVREDSGERRLVAYVVGGADPDALRAHLRHTLPEYMVPAAIVAVPSLPLTPNGKLDVRALPAPDFAGAEDRFTAPRTPAEEVLAGIWAEVLGIGRVGVETGFFDLGGHSLLATRVVSRVRAVFGVELPLRALFEAPTVAGLAERVEELRRADLPPLPPVVPVDRAGPLPLSFAQERLWFLDRMEPGSAFYNIPSALRLRGPLDAAALERALGEIVRRHGALRTFFAQADGAPVQVVAPFAGFALPVEPVPGEDDGAREAELRRLAADEAARPFDLAAGPLLRARLLRLGEDDHALLVTLHHVAGDGWSMGVLFRELSALYGAFRDGLDPALPEPPVQYADYAVWQRERLEGATLERQLAYWRERLAGAPALLELPTDRPRPAVRGSAGAQQPLELPAELLDALQALARREGATLYMVLLAAFQLLLSRYSGSDDVVVGSPIAGRTRRETEELIGFFVNTLVLRTDLSGDPSFRALLARVRETTLGAYEHQEVPFERLVAELQPERSLSHSPLFQVMFTLENAAEPWRGLPGVRAEGVEAEMVSTGFDLTLFLGAHAGGLRGALAYSTELFEPGTAARMAAHLRRVLEGVAADPGAPLSRLDLLGGDERRQVVREWNRTEAAYPVDACIHHLFQDQAARTPASVAAVHGTESLTYGELNARANRLAHHLRRLGVGPESRVGICLERGLDLVVSLLAVLKAGGAYLPLDPAYPAERLAFTLDDAGARVLVTHRALLGVLPEQPGMRTVVLEEAAAVVAAENAGNPEVDVSPRGLAYLIYTSGSTGRPKGVGVEHGSVVALLSWASGIHTDEELSGMLFSTSICFDLSVYELFLPLARGGRIIVVENALALSGAPAADQVRLINTVPSALAALLAIGCIPPGVRTVVSCGEVLSGTVVDGLYAHGIGRVYDMYGPSEDTVYSTWVLRAAGGPATIGRPIHNTQAYVLDAALRPVPAGVAGELWLGGRGLARGYLGRPALTAERFVPDPFSDGGGRLYRTGDRARWRPDGTLEYLGRADAQVKIRGFRIEPGEIEAALRRHPDVRACAVVAREHAPGDKRLVAYVVGAADAEALRAHLRQSLPEHMVPGAFVSMETLPLTPNGKLDRRALPAPALDPARRLEPGTELEARIAEIWRALLGVEVVGVEDNFFDLGGHSLLLVRLQARLERELGPGLSVVELFQYPTVRALAARLQGIAGAPPDREAIREQARRDAKAHVRRRPDVGARPRERNSERTVERVDPTRERDAARDAERSAKRAAKHAAERVRARLGGRPGGKRGGGTRRSGLEVAVVGMAGRFPGADDVDAFWSNLREGVESISFFTREQLLEAGVAPEVLDLPGFVGARGELRGADEFDAALFGLTPRDAEILDPQHRVLLETAWAALEHAGCDPSRAEHAVGLFAGSSNSVYIRHLQASPELVRSVGMTRITLGNDRDHLAAGVAYRLNLNGPVLAVQTACSTSLVAVHLACQSLASGECGVALAGGVSVQLPLRGGYVFSPDGILSPDGHCRAFDADARGTVAGNGAGIVVLKRLDDALADGDTIHAVIRGTAINNDGSHKVGYTAPSVTGQAGVLNAALRVAGVEPETVQYLESHGTGTPLGDAIELKALGEVLPRGADHPVAIGSVKTNIGHLDAAAGVAGLIKTVLALEHAQIPPSLNFAVPHPGIAEGGGRVFVNTALRPWDARGGPRRAGVSSFGIGGTNAHVVLEEAPPREPSGPSRPRQLLVLSARTPSALARAAERLAEVLDGAAPPLADAAYTLRTGRRELEHRLAVVCADAAEGAARLREVASTPVPAVPRTDRPVAFLFPGVGNHYADMGRGLYDAEPAFRAAVDQCCELLRPVLGSDLRDVLYPGDGEAGAPERRGWDLRRLLGRGADVGDADSPLDETRFAQPAVFVTEYALAALWMSWGVRPRALIGHSLGEYVAATVAGVLRLEDALRLVALRARLIERLPAGAMLAVPLGEAELRPMLPPALDVAAVNTPGSCVVAGPADAVDAFAALLAERGTVSRRLPARHAFHSRDMAPVAAELERLAAGFALRAPEIPFVSNVTGTWISDDEARSPGYWARHLTRTVRFADGAATLRRQPGWVLLEVGPGQTLGAWALQHPEGGAPGDHAVFGSLRHQHNRVADDELLLQTLGGLWAAGVQVDWTAFSRGERRHRVVLPGYAFERKRYWVDAPRTDAPAEHGRTPAADAAQGPAATEQTEEANVMRNQAPAAPAPSRADAVLAYLKGLVAELTGVDEGHVDAGGDFFAAGFDSLLLLQAIQAIEKRVGVRISLIELLEQTPSLGALALHIDRVLPPEAAPFPLEAAVPEAAAPEPPRTVPAPPALYPPPAAAEPAAGTALPAAGESVLERVIAQQLQLMAQQQQVMGQQIAALRGEALAPAASSSAAPASTGAVPNGNGSHGVGSNGPASNGSGPHGAGPNGTGSGGSKGTAVSVSRAVPQSPRARITPETFVAYQPLNTEAASGMTPVQQAYLEDFIARYTERTRASKAHQARYHRPLADSRVTAKFRRTWKEILYPIVGDRALGSHVWDLDGNDYVDIGMAFGCNLFGHAPDFIEAAIQEQLRRGFGVGPQSRDAGRAAELVCELGGTRRAVFCNSGTEAVSGAIRAARALTGRSRIAYFAGSYHGWADAVLGRMFVSGDRREVRPSAPGVPALPLGDVLMLDFDEPASLELLAEHIHDIALVMVEPVQSRRPDLQPFAFLKELRRMTREAGALLLFDELITGFRMAPGGAQAFFGIDADLVTYGKIVAGGLPMGVVAGTEEAMSVFDGGMWRYGDDSYPTAQRTLFAGAYFKHPISMAVACAVLGEIQRQGQPMYDRLNERTTRLVERINRFLEDGGYPITAAHFASSFRFFFGPEVKFPELFNHHLIHEGIHVIPETGTHFLSIAHTDEDLEKVFQAVRASAEAMRRGGLIPPRGGGPGGSEPDPRPAPALSAPPAATSSVDGDAAAVRVVPLTEGQRQLWIESQMGEDAPLAYIESLSIRLHGALDAGALRGALQALVDRHDTLRATFSPDGTEQRIHPSLELEVPLQDFRAVPAESRDGEVQAWVRRTVRRPFDLAAGPLVRWDLAAVGDDEHLLVFAAHHAVVDGWSIGILLRELSALYAARREGRDAALAEPPRHADLVRSQVAAVAGDAAAEAYWTARFADGVPVLELPTDRPRPAVRSYRGERARRVLGDRLMERLAAAGRPHGLSLFHIVLSACTLWLSRLSGQDDVVVGTPSAGQAGRAEAAELVGYGINLLPVRTRVDQAETFVELVRRVRRGVMGAVEHQNFSFPRLVETVLRTRDPGRPPLFSVMLDLDRERGTAYLGDLRAELESNFGGGSKVDLNLEITETADELRLACDYSTDLFDAATIDAWIAAYHRLLEQVAADPAAPLSRLALVGDAERRQVVEGWNRTDRPFPDGATVHDRFAAQVERTPDAPALEWGGESLTYRELDARANRLAQHLAGLGVGPDERVGILLERTLEMVVTTLAVLKAGGCCVPVDTSYPAERMRLMLADAGARVVLTRGELSAARDLSQEAEELRTVHLDALGGALAAAPAGAPRSGAAAGNLAYVFYTSGSTGRPKGVMMAHREVVQFAAGVPECMPMGPGDRVAQASNASFDAAVFEIWGALLNGATLVGIDRDVLLSAPALKAALEAERITHLYQTAALFSQHVRQQVDVYAGLKQLVFGAEAVGTESVRQMLRAGRPGRVLHEYGPTEATVWCTLEPVEAIADDASTVPIGVPVPNARAYVLDPAGTPQPACVPGELYVGGAGVVRGYLGRPSLTAEKFVPDPFSAEPGARMYRTGDRVRWRAEGRLEFMGRLDEQVKIRGFRIEPGEVEGVLSAFPGVRQARVIVREDAPGDKRLVAYLAGDADGEALRAHLRQRLPEYMVPAAFVAMERLPLTPNGKLDRRALPAPEYASAEERYVAPRTPAEEVLARIWGEVLRVDRVGAADDFFALGGHSLLAVRVVSRVRDELGVELPLRTVFEAPTVAGLTEHVERLRRAELPPVPPVVGVDRSGPLPLSFAQERLWFLDRLQPGGAFFNIPVALRVEGELDPPALERALGEIVRRHEALRTVFAGAEGAPVQVIAPFAGFRLAVEPLGAEGDAAEEEARRIAGEEAARPFDLSAGPLLRARLLRLGERDHVLLVTMHHAVSDGWSLELFFRELSSLYGAFHAGREPALPPLPVQYADFAVWQRGQLRGEALERQLAYWRARLAGAPELLQLPADHPRPGVMSFRGANVPIHIPHALQERLESLARREGATLFMVVLAAFQTLLSRAGGGADVVVGTTLAGRTRAETEPLIGLFMNTLVLRTDLSGDPDFREVLRRVREVTLGAYEHQDVPFERLVEELRPARSLSHSPLFQVLFELHHDAGGGAPALPGLALRPVDNGSAAAKVDLGVSLRATPRGLLGELTYAADLFEPGTARRMVEQLERVLKQVATEPERRLSRLELMGRAERKRLLEWNRTTTRYPATRCIHHLFEDQADRTPGSEAVRFEARSWSYGELEARANQLAHRLRRMGVGPEVRVGICMERGLELMACILGVMKAGGAYVPADPAHPAERIAWVMEDSAVAVLLTQERLRGRLPAREGMAVLAVDAAWGEIAAESAARPEGGAGSENLAYVIYTSGSTGRPKGVAMHHRGVCNYIHWGIKAYGAERGSGAPVFSSMAVDLTITNLLPLFAGRPVRFLPEENPVEALAEVLREEPGFGLIKITPVHLSLLTPLLTPGEARAAAHTLVIGADFLSAEPTLFWQEHAPGVQLMNEYGPTETVVGCSAYVLPGGRHRAGPVPVGRPIQNLSFYVFDAHLEPVPAGLPGELYIGGAGVARGYLGRPGLTAEKFVPDPFAEPGARMYRTGDRARWQADGNLMVLGRTDNQVKIRGYRVELGEVETVLRRHDGVRGALAVVREDRPGDRRLVAYVVGDAGTEALRAYLRQALPEYMVPDAFVHLESLPQTATGKLDPRTLPAPRYGGGEEWDEPRNYVEARLIPLWEELLGVEGIGPSQSFFELGGNSLLALRLFTRVNRQLECDLPVATLFAGATVRHMADAILAQKQSAEAPGSVVPLQPEGTLPPVFFVHAADRDVMGYVNLVRHLGPDQPAYGVRDVGRDLGRPVERIAAEHVAAVRAVQPHGPYQLVSWSFGGIVAFEMACQLEAAGETVGLVGLLDTVSPALMDAWGWDRAADVFVALAHDLASMQRRPFALDPAALDGLDDEEQARRTVQALREQDAAPPVEPGRLAADLLQAFRNVRDRTRSYSGYRPGVLGAPLVLFRAMEAEERRAAFFATRSEDERRALGWTPHAAGPVQVHHVPGSHMVIASEPHVRVLARLMRESLAAAAGRLEAGAGAGAHD